MDLAVAAIVFGIVALAELPDTSSLAAVVLGSRYPPRLVLIGAIAAHTVQTVLAVAAGSVVALLPRRPLEAALVVVFLVAAVLILREDDDDDDEPDLDAAPRSPWRVIATAFGVVLLAELGDPTQIVTATLAARYEDPLAVGIGAALALWVVSAIAVYGGDRLRHVLPEKWLTRIAAAILVVLAVFTAVDAITG